MIYRVTYKRFSEMQKNLVLIDDDIEAEGYEVNDAGVLMFYSGGRLPLTAIPPGLWLLVEPAATIARAQLVHTVTP